MGRLEFLASERIMRAISSAPISRMLVAQRMAPGTSYSSAVSAYAAWVLVFTSKPSRFNASPRRLAKYTLLSISRTLMGRAAGITAWPPLCPDGKNALHTNLDRSSAGKAHWGPELVHPDSTLQ